MPEEITTLTSLDDRWASPEAKKDGESLKAVILVLEVVALVSLGVAYGFVLSNDSRTPQHAAAELMPQVRETVSLGTKQALYVTTTFDVITSGNATTDAMFLLSTFSFLESFTWNRSSEWGMLFRHKNTLHLFHIPCKGCNMVKYHVNQTGMFKVKEDRYLLLPEAPNVGWSTTPSRWSFYGIQVDGLLFTPQHGGVSFGLRKEALLPFSTPAFLADKSNTPVMCLPGKCDGNPMLPTATRALNSPPLRSGGYDYASTAIEELGGWKVVLAVPTPNHSARDVWPLVVILAAAVIAIALNTTGLLMLMRRLLQVAELLSSLRQKLGNDEWGDLAVGVFNSSWRELQMVESALVDLIEGVRELKQDCIDKCNSATTAVKIASRQKDEFIACMSHEMRTPLNGIIGFNTMLGVMELTDPQRTIHEGIESSSATLLSLINDILDFSKLGFNEVVLERIAYDLRADVIDKAVSMLAVKADEKNLNFICDVHPEIPEGVFGDPHRLTQVLVNLLGNSIKFTAEGKVTINVFPMQPERCKLGSEADEIVNKLLWARSRYRDSTQSAFSGYKDELEECSKGFNLEEAKRSPGRKEADNESYIVFAVCDSGVGFSREVASRLFQPFQQADASSSRQFGGTGLGLYICKRVICLMDGYIAGFSDGDGTGSQFVFMIPIQKKRDPPHCKSEPKIVAILASDERYLKALTNAVLSYSHIRAMPLLLDKNIDLNAEVQVYRPELETSSQGNSGSFSRSFEAQLGSEIEDHGKLLETLEPLKSYDSQDMMLKHNEQPTCAHTHLHTTTGTPPQGPLESSSWGKELHKISEGSTGMFTTTQFTSNPLVYTREHTLETSCLSDKTAASRSRKCVSFPRRLSHSAIQSEDEVRDLLVEPRVLHSYRDLTDATFVIIHLADTTLKDGLVNLSKLKISCPDIQVLGLYPLKSHWLTTHHKDCIWLGNPVKHADLTKYLAPERLATGNIGRSPHVAPLLGKSDAHILIVDDVKQNRYLLDHKLRRWGYVNVSQAEDGQQAVNMCMQTDFDLIFMDCCMPRMDGFMATKIIRQDPRYHHTPIFGLTAEAVPQDGETGMTRMLTKPFVDSMIKDSLRHAGLMVNQETKF
eukprot:Sspe_Gene.42370::Locus_20571_Transcript_1_1_Confidence_1.000_Length_3401::g.42370::m.42370